MKILKLKTLLVVGLFSVGLVGCNSITPQELLNADILCAERGGIRELRSYSLWSITDAECMDGHIKSLKKIAN